ncbi:MAG TPA: hypothetical protein VGB02_19750 [Pyrinomonadaceae bacterium]|jgi:hypothetical protein
MKRKLAYFASSFALAGAIVFGGSYQSEASSAQSCQGQCKRNQTACEQTATTQGQKSQCKKSYQGCISSCK